MAEKIEFTEVLKENFLQKLLIQRAEADCLCGVTPQISVKQENDTFYRISCIYDLEEDGIQDDCAVRIFTQENPVFAWSPHLTPEEGYIAQQHIFRTPALIFQYQTGTIILCPDPAALNGNAVQAYLDMDVTRGMLSVGLSESAVAEHVLYQKRPGAHYPKGKIELAFYLMITEEVLENPFRPVLSFYWENYGKEDSLKTQFANCSLEPYIKHTYNWAFDRWKDVVWQEFTENGKQVGAPVFIVTTKQSPNYHGTKKERELRSIWNQAWFCSLRSASGLYRYARRNHRQDLMEYAEKTKELALAFPQEDGLFDSVTATEMETFESEGQVFQRSLGWDTRYWGNSDRNPFGLDVRHAPRHILDMSFTAEYMLIWYEELEKDERLLSYAGSYAERLLTMQDEAGYFPGWVDQDGNRMGILDHSPESAMTAVFLLHYGRLMEDERFRKAALKAIEVLEKEVIPVGRWEDFETYYSCSRWWSDHVGEKIARNNMYKQCNFSMFYMAWALLEAYETTGSEHYLETGRRVLDEMLMTQSSYQPQHMPISVVGGFGVLNADGELNDARQGLYSELILRYGKVLGEKEYTERGLAALRMAFSMMYCPENPEVKVQWEKAWPFFGEMDYGFTMENYGHVGKVDAEGLGIGEFTIYDWGNGAAAESYERIRAHFGETFINDLSEM